MMAKTKGKYQTDFKTYEEAKRIFNSIPENDRLEWAENLDPKLLRMKNNNGRTVAHGLAYSGTLPERFITEELLRMKDNVGWTVAHGLAWSGTLPLENMTDKLFMMKDNDGKTVAGSFCDYLSQYCKWDLLTLLTPVILGCSYHNETSVVSKITRVLADMDERTLMETLSLMPAETILILADRIPDSPLRETLRETIRRYIEKETEKEIFEIPSGTDDSGTEGDLCDDRDGLYEAERER